MSSRRRLTTVVLGTALLVLASGSGSHAADPEPAPPAAAAPESTVDSTVEPTPEPSVEPAPVPAAEPAADPTGEPTPEPAPDAAPSPTPDATSEPTPEPTPVLEAGESSIGGAAGGSAAATRSVRPQSIRSSKFRLVVERVTRGDVPYTYRPGCPVKPSGLRLLRLTHYGFDREFHRGEIVVRASAVGDVSGVFRRALEDRFPIRLMRRVDRYRGSDEKSMARDNTSAFNCRHVVGNPSRLSQHSYGNAVDVNTRENPYVTASRVYPPGSATYLNRSNVRKGMLIRSGPVPREFAARGWFWGARWRHPDYQHFSSNGR